MRELHLCTLPSSERNILVSATETRLEPELSSRETRFLQFGVALDEVSLLGSGRGGLRRELELVSLL